MDYGTRIADAAATKDASYGTYNKYAGQADQAKAQYDTAFGQRQGYGDIYDSTRNKYMNTDEVNAAKGAYQNSRDAINLMNTTMNKLPESISQRYGGTGLTEAQRARAMGQQQQQMGNTYNYLNTNYQNALGDYQDLSNKAMQETQNVAGIAYQSQQDALNAQQDYWRTLLGQSNNAYTNYQGDRSALAGVYSEQDRNRQLQEQMALERWKEQQANDRAQKQLNLQSYLANVAAEQNKAAASLQSQLADKQSRADYNRYVKEIKQGAADKQQKEIENWWGRMWDNEGVQSRAADDYRNSVNNMLSYDQWAGNV